MKIPAYIFLLFIIVFSSCDNVPYVPDLSETIDYDYMATNYSKNGENMEVSGYNYYNKEKQLIESVYHENRAKYKYRSDQKLKEKQYCRMYDCEFPIREIYLYDRNSNLVGMYRTLSNMKVNMDTVSIDTAFFYDKENRLVKKLISSGNYHSGKPYEKWRSFKYQDSFITHEITTINEDTNWIGTYSYDQRGNLISIYRTNKDKFEKETFEYDKDNRLIKQNIINDRSPLADNVSYNVKNHKIIYSYNQNGFLNEEIKYNHKNEIVNHWIYKYSPKN